MWAVSPVVSLEPPGGLVLPSRGRSSDMLSPMQRSSGLDQVPRGTGDCSAQAVSWPGLRFKAPSPRSARSGRAALAAQQRDVGAFLGAVSVRTEQWVHCGNVCGCLCIDLGDSRLTPDIPVAKAGAAQVGSGGQCSQPLGAAQALVSNPEELLRSVFAARWLGDAQNPVYRRSLGHPGVGQSLARFFPVGFTAES